jgi:ubiquinone/menaquinone biosynthesis C-methylase UbiE
MEKKWSVYFQNPEFIELIRMTMALPEYKPLIRKWCGIRDGAKVLDVGCGTGYFARLLASGDEDITVTGIDRDDVFIDYAKEKTSEEGLDIDYVLGDALHLPFEDNSFDVVGSHTFLTSMPSPKEAFDEMKRVVRPGGIIASVTSMSFYPPAVSLGKYPEECDVWKKELDVLVIRLTRAYLKIDPLTGRATGVAPALLPHFFAEQGMEQVSAYPVGHMNSVSNAAMSDEDKLRWIELYRESEIRKLDAFMELPEMLEMFSHEQAARYRELLDQKCGFLRSDLTENRIWDWRGNVNLLVTGRKPLEE